MSEAPVVGGAGDIATLVVDFSDMESVRLAAAEALESVIRQIEAWCPGDQPQDDITLLSIDVTPADHL